MINIGQVVVGIILILITVGALLYIFYSRTNAVEKTGYSALAMLALVSLMIPLFWIVEGNNQATAQSAQHALAVERGMELYVQYCTDKCYAIDKAGKIKDPKWNGYTIDQLNNLSDNQLTRVISGGIYAPGIATPANANLIIQSQDFGGQLSSNDVDYLFAFLRSADPTYLQKNGFTGDSAVNGFNLIPGYLQKNGFTSQYATAQAIGTVGQFGAPVDMTKSNAITITIVQTSTTQQCDSGCYEMQNVKVKVGTKITWVNKSSVGHTVSAIIGESTASPKVANNIFNSAGSNLSLIPPGGTYTYTVTKAAYNLNPDHAVVYYCQVHPTYMFAELTIVQ